MSTTSSASQDRSQGIRLIKAAEAGDFKSVETLIAAGVDVNSPTEHGMTALMSAAANDHLGLVTHLLACGADINARRNDGLDALALAVFFGHPDVVRELLAAGADAKAKSRFGTSLEAWAISRGLPDIAKMLIESKSDKPPAPRSDQSNLSPAEHVGVQESPFSQGVLAAEVFSDDTDFSTKEAEAPSIPVQVLNDSTVHNEFISSSKASAPACESPGLKVTDETYRENQFTRFLAYMTYDWQRLTLVTLIVMLICGLGTFSLLKLLGPGPEAFTSPNVLKPAASDLQHFNALKQSPGSMGRRNEIHTPQIRDAWAKPSTYPAKKSKAAIPQSNSTEKSSRLIPGTRPLRKSEERSTDGHPKETTLNRETQTASYPTPIFKPDGGSAKKTSPQNVFVLAPEEPAVKTAGAPRESLDVEMQRPGRSAAPAEATRNPIRGAKSKVIQWP